MAVLSTVTQHFKNGRVHFCLQDHPFIEDGIPNVVLLSLGESGFECTYHMNIEEFREFTRNANMLLNLINENKWEVKTA